LGKATVSFVMCLSVCPSAWNNTIPTGRIFMKFECFKHYWEHSIFINMGQEWLVLYMKTNTHFWSHPTELFPEWEKFQTKLVEKIKTHLVNNNFFFKSCPLWNNGKIFRARQVTDDNMGLALCVLDTYRLCNTYWFSTATVVARTRRNIELYLQCLSCYLLRNKQTDRHTDRRTDGWI